MSTAPDLNKQLADLRSQMDELVQKQTDSSRDLVNQKMQAFGRMAGSIAHDLNNSLLLVIGNCDFLLERVQRSGAMYNYITEIKMASEQAVGLARRLMSFSTQRVFQPVVTNANSIVKMAEKQIRDTLNPSIVFTVDLSAERCLVKVEPTELERILVHFAANARDAMPSGGTFVIATAVEDLPVSLYGLLPGKYIGIRIEDTGAGMDTATSIHVFEPFFTTKNADTNAGIGLFTAYALIKQFSGAITCESQPGTGTNFTIFLPLVEMHETPVVTPIAKTNPAQISILVVDDDANVRSLLRKSLGFDGYQISEAGDGASALKILEHIGEVDLLLTDVVMPGMTGPELGQRAAVLRPNLRILYTSGFSEDPTLRSAGLSSKAQFMQKPYTPTQLRARIKEMLGLA